MPHLNTLGHVARHLQLRSPDSLPQASTNVTHAADGASNRYADEIVDHSKATTTALAVVVAVLAIIIIAGTFFYRLKMWHMKKAKEQNNAPDNGPSSGAQKVDFKLSTETEKPQTVVFNTSDDSEVGWKPQLKEYRGVVVTGKQFEKNMTSSKARSKWEKAMLKGAETLKIATPQSSPPPSYITSADVAPNGPHIVVDGPTGKLPTPPMTPGANGGLAVPAAETGPLPSPIRTASFAHQQFVITESKDGSPKGPNGKPARLMTVTNTFIRSLDDELAIKVGDTVRMFEEYQDGWCLCQSVGKSDARKGVVPRFCLVEFKKPLPTVNGGKRNLTDAYQPVPL